MEDLHSFNLKLDDSSHIIVVVAIDGNDDGAGGAVTFLNAGFGDGDDWVLVEVQGIGGGEVVVDLIDDLCLSVLVFHYFGEGFEFADVLPDVDGGVSGVDKAEPEFLEYAFLTEFSDLVAEAFG